MNLYFTYESRDTLKSFTLIITVKAIAKLNLGHRNKFEIEFWKISCRSSRSSDNAEFDHFTLLFCRGRQRNVQRRTYTAIRFCSLNLSFVSQRSRCRCSFLNWLPIDYKMRQATTDARRGIRWKLTTSRSERFGLCRWHCTLQEFKGAHTGEDHCIGGCS